MNGKDALQKLIAETQQGEVVFSTHAHVALQVRLALDDPEIHMEKAASIVQMEPMLAAKVVGLANSVAFNRSGRTISDVRSAVTPLGLSGPAVTSASNHSSLALPSCKTNIWPGANFLMP